MARAAASGLRRLERDGGLDIIRRSPRIVVEHGLIGLDASGRLSCRAGHDVLPGLVRGHVR